MSVSAPTSEFSPMRIDTQAKKLFEESGLSPIKSLPSAVETESPERLDFEEEVNMMEDIIQEEVDMVEEIIQEDVDLDVTETLEKITIDDDKEVSKAQEERFQNVADEVNSPVMVEVSQKILETSLKVIAEHHPRLEELKKKARRLSDRMAEITESRRRSSLLNSPADQINATLSEMFEKPKAESAQVISDSIIVKTTSERSVVSDSLAASGDLEKQASDLFSKSLNSSSIDGGTYTVHHSENSFSKPLEPRMTAGSFHAPGFSSPLHGRSMQMLDDINTPTQLLTMNESAFVKSARLNSSEKSGTDIGLMGVMSPENMLNITTPTRRSVLKSNGNTPTAAPAEKSNVTNHTMEEPMMEDVQNPSTNIYESTFQSVNSSNTLPLAPPTPGFNRMSYIQNLNMLVPLEEEEEEERQMSAVNRFPHLAELIKEEKMWKESQGKNTSIHYSKKYGNGDSLMVDNSFVMAQSVAFTPGKGMRGVEPSGLFEEELGDSISGQSLANSSIFSVGKSGKQKNPDIYTMSSYVSFSLLNVIVINRISGLLHSSSESRRGFIDASTRIPDRATESFWRKLKSSCSRSLKYMRSVESRMDRL